MKVKPALQKSYGEAATEYGEVSGSIRIVEHRLRLPESLHFLMLPATAEHGGGRFKVLYGGRGSAKSMSIAQSLLTRGFNAKLKILCAREIQNSIKDSVHALLKTCIEMLGMQDFYDVRADGIYGRNGTEFILSLIHI